MCHLKKTNDVIIIILYTEKETGWNALFVSDITESVYDTQELQQ